MFLNRSLLCPEQRLQLLVKLMSSSLETPQRDVGGHLLDFLLSRLQGQWFQRLKPLKSLGANILHFVDNYIHVYRWKWYAWMMHTPCGYDQSKPLGGGSSQPFSKCSLPRTSFTLSLQLSEIVTLSPVGKLRLDDINWLLTSVQRQVGSFRPSLLVSHSGCLSLFH